MSIDFKFLEKWNKDEFETIDFFTIKENNDNLCHCDICKEVFFSGDLAELHHHLEKFHHLQHVRLN